MPAVGPSGRRRLRTSVTCGGWRRRTSASRRPAGSKRRGRCASCCRRGQIWWEPAPQRKSCSNGTRVATRRRKPTLTDGEAMRIPGTVRRAILLLSLAVALLAGRASSQQTQAGPPGQAEAHLAKGYDALKEDRYTVAVDEFRAAL